VCHDGRGSSHEACDKRETREKEDEEWVVTPVKAEEER
jgi:hypothetical protein